VDLKRVFDVAKAATEAGSAVALSHFRRGVTVELKADQSPVTIADREAEAAIFAVIRDAFPEHGILGEESGEVIRSDTRWIVDPIDGTRGFTAGGSFWGPLIALEHEGRIVAGALALPVLGETYVAARGLGCWNRGERVKLSSVTSWDAATLSLGEIRRIAQRVGWERFESLVSSCLSVRSFGDVGAAVMLLSGRADAWLEAGVSPWDIAPQKVLVEEAGGRVTDLSDTKSAILATNGHLHDHVLRAITDA
jgi:histidinol-phosphatase